ncbi:type VII secretion protein EccE [Actinacidiphila acididurans]|uniref:Type VII secretion protein EccE n=1 Tax=Actinacidiphila acididurans TaxID=2784346 RepID=A0ABS2TKY6_9ACTN|nr:type VII secretion protein EccE [Actinacidiphila acididurans]
MSGRRDGRRAGPTVATAGGREAAAVMHVQPRAGRLGGVWLHQVVLIEVAAAVVLVGWAVSRRMIAPAAVVALALVLVAVVRRRGRPVVEWLRTIMGLRRRQRTAVDPRRLGEIEPSLGPVVECDPALRTYAYTDRKQDRGVGMVGDGTFLTAVVRVQARDEPLRPARSARPLPLETLYGVLEVDDIRLESAQIVQHTHPAPAPHLPEQSIAARSYAQLQAQSGAPATRLTWVALKFDPELCPEAVRARGGGLGGAQRALLRAADQLASRLAGAGFDAEVLSEAELTAALATSSGANPLASSQAQAGRAAGDARRTAETSRAWRCDDRWHTTYWVARWPKLGVGATPSANLVALLTSMPAMASTFSLAVSRGAGGAPALTGHVRLTARSENELVAARRNLQRAARGVRAGLVRLDREQVPGVLATLPLGGTR